MRSGTIGQHNFLTVDVTRVRSTDSQECASPAFKPREDAETTATTAATTTTPVPNTTSQSNSSSSQPFLSSMQRGGIPPSPSFTLSQRTPDRSVVEESWRMKDQASIFRSPPMHPLATSSRPSDMYSITRCLAFDEMDDEC